MIGSGLGKKRRVLPSLSANSRLANDIKEVVNLKIIVHY